VPAYQAIYDTLRSMEQQLAEWPELARLFASCYVNSLETSVELLADGTTFVSTGDIPAMWLRDATAQIMPYVPLARDDPDVRRLVVGLIRRQAHYIFVDAYANAFNREPTGLGTAGDQPVPHPLVWERKFELDSLCSALTLCSRYWEATGDPSVFDASVREMLRTIVRVLRTEQDHDHASTYTFGRTDPWDPIDTLPGRGKGTRTNWTGMVWSGFRPSDDACTFGYLIPANMFAVVALGALAALAADVLHDAALHQAAVTLRDEIEFGIQTYGIVEHPHYGRMYAYETDGFGNYRLMDDANVPSLLSIPYLGYRPANDPLYCATRRFVLSAENPYYYAGRAAHGVGSPHTPRGSIWPMSLIIQAMTASDSTEEAEVLRMLVETTAGTHLMHESFDADDPSRFTRPWFGWANSLFAEYVLRRAARRTNSVVPHAWPG
jgi:meiotically up-regulated gene 157 (Mug157) protein